MLSIQGLLSSPDDDEPRTGGVAGAGQQQQQGIRQRGVGGVGQQEGQQHQHQHQEYQSQQYQSQQYQHQQYQQQHQHQYQHQHQHQHQQRRQQPPPAAPAATNTTTNTTTASANPSQPPPPPPPPPPESDIASYIDDLLKRLDSRGKGMYTCPHEHACQSGGVDRHGALVVFERNSAFKLHLRKHERPFKCDLPGCTNTRGFARCDQLRRHQDQVRHG